MKPILILMVLLTIVNVSAADTEFGIYQQNQPVELIQVCSNSTALCDVCNISSVKYPNSTFLLENAEMTPRDYDFNYTLEGSLTTARGTYLVQGFCIAGTEYKVFSYDFDVTPTGDELSTSQGTIYLIFLLGVFGTFILVCWIAFKIPTGHTRDTDGKIITVNEYRWVKIFFFVIAYLLLMWTFGILRSVSANYLLLSGAGRLFEYFFYIMLIAVWPLIVLSLIGILLSITSNKKINKMLKRGIPVR